MKKNIAMRLASLVLMCTIVTSCFVGSTFAKYTSSVSGKDTVVVADWNIDFKQGNTAFEDGAEFDLFTTIYDTDNAVETDVETGMVAPGTKGSFSFTIAYDTDVNFTYEVKYALYTDPSCTEEYKYDGYNPFTFTNDSLSGTVTMGTGEKIATVNWAWPFEVENGANDEDDVDLAGTILYVGATITATQID